MIAIQTTWFQSLKHLITHMHLAHQAIRVSIYLTELLLSGMGSSQATYDSSKKLSVYLIEVKAVLFSIILFNLYYLLVPPLH